LWVSYTGQDFAPQTSFNHGASFGAAWLGFAPIYAGVAYLWTPKQALKQPLAFDIQRFPASAYAGYRFVQGIFRIDTELGVTVEWLHRSTAARVPASPVDRSGPSTRIVVGLAPRLAGEVQPLPYLGLFAALGFDTLLTDFKYIEEEPQGSQTLLAPNRVRTVAMAGVAFYPY
jgi:hypothetical protein